MKHNKLTAKFTIAQTFNLALIGMYTLTIRSEINVPNDYTMTTSRVMFVEEIVNVFVQPCNVNTYTAKTTVTSITYYIGDPAVTDGRYVFDESPVCNYPETVTVTNLPTFATHNTGTADFTIQTTTDLSLIGQYIVTINSMICVPDDYTQESCTIKQVQYDFVIKMEPCKIDTYNSVLVAGVINYNIGTPDVTGGSYSFV